MFLPYPPIEGHGVIGDRRTAALVAADGTIDWYCVPDYDGVPVFGSLLDSRKGGFWRFGPAAPAAGTQQYLESTAVLLTRWQTPYGTLELCDFMTDAEDDRQQGAFARTIVRRVTCLSGRGAVALRMLSKASFRGASQVARQDGNALFLDGDDHRFGFWCSYAVGLHEGVVAVDLELRAGDTVWAVLGLNQSPFAGGVPGAELLLKETVAYWKKWSQRLTVSPQEREQIERSAITVHLLTFAPAGSAVAAVTSSLPERVEGDRNWDYRFAWVRDTSLSLALLALLGKAGEVGKYLDWLSHRDSIIDAPLQVMYHPDGRCEVDPEKVEELEGYRNCRPVRLGNGAYRERQHGAVGYLADCTLIYLDNGGRWQDEYWELIRKVAQHTVRVWREPDNGIWEMGKPVHWVSSKVMCWVVLDRAIRIAEKVGKAAEAEQWKPVRDEIRRDVLQRGWSEEAQSFRQHYDNDEIDAALLLIPVMEFLPPDDPRVVATVGRIERELCINGFVHRFHPETTPGVDSDLPLGVFECAFFPTTFWLATTYAKGGRADEAKAILDRCQQLVGEVGLFAEGVDAFTESCRGNTPLIFSQVEYARARLALAHHHSLRDTSMDEP
jgi:GH15 family glucan-1,4-alpha-glucosidase